MMSHMFEVGAAVWFVIEEEYLKEMHRFCQICISAI